MIADRIEKAALRNRIVAAAEAAGLIKNAMTVAFSGYTACGYPKLIGSELARRKKGGEDLKINLTAGAQIGPEVFDELAEADVLNRVSPLIGSKTLAAAVNAGRVRYVEQQMSKLPRLLRSGALGEIDVAVVEAVAVTKDGFIVPSNSVGMTPNFVNAAKEIIVEINLAQPIELCGLHDVYLPAPPPNTRPIPLTRVGERIGEPFIRLDPAKIKYIVESNTVEDSIDGSSAGVNPAITANLMNFLELEFKRNWGGRLFPIQTGFGNMTNALLAALGESAFTDLEFFCGGVSEAHIRLMAQGKIKSLSAGSLKLSPMVRETLKSKPELFREMFVLRNTEVCNGLETVGRLGVVAVNTGVEIDIYGNVNSSHIAGSKVVNGLGGGANFAQSSLLSIVVQPSVTKNGDISSIVPMVSHHDIIEHDVDVIVTENGVADLRGLDDVERAELIISRCAHETYREELRKYLASAAKNGGHHPLCLDEALSWHSRLKNSGSMRPLN
ncbi:hypothetical protein LJB99_01250 [Deltaproteobacteria bacterium OttesenSCG-928-K17]|nr:hypothetical protein [Deltaproteobacteria bacterium OttesenSCG-928-K17]